MNGSMQRLALVLAVWLLALAGCGGGGGDTASPGNAAAGVEKTSSIAVTTAIVTQQ